MNPAARRRVLLGLAAVAVVLFAAGLAVGFAHRHDTICPNGKPPVAQRDEGLGQVAYRCSDGRVVTK